MTITLIPNLSNISCASRHVPSPVIITACGDNSASFSLIHRILTDTKYLCFIKSVFEARLIFKNIIINADDFIYGTNSSNQLCIINITDSNSFQRIRSSTLRPTLSVTTIVFCCSAFLLPLSSAQPNSIIPQHSRSIIAIILLIFINTYQ